MGSLSPCLPLLARPASVEQHSLHLPVFVDSMICEEVAARTHARIPEQVLVLPTQHIG